MKSLLPALFLITSLSLPLLANAGNEAILNSILQKHMEAMGGLRNWSQVESIRLTGKIERNEQIVDLVIIKKRPNQIRATVTVPLPGTEDQAIQVIRAHNGQSAWTATRRAGAPDMTPTELIGDEADSLLSEAGVLPPLIKLWRSGEKLTFAGSSPFNGEQAFVIEHQHKSKNKQQRFYLSVETYRTLAYESKTPTESTLTTLGHYQQQDGILIPTQSTVTSQTTGVSKMNMSSIEIGVGIYDEYFETSAQSERAEL
ncbi:hypothetical protein QEH59_07665 [Coraliomargarita sp. SDUM461004]|uniref:Outer membrane lipoprotein-sorting protein n=1 Tax=Thalassobacterium sedimentorum TaxID=3041258 RepID=A0ABU1AHK0_9BACT|nr:hypothetical protein [Coraliomargarita sp. SDUM461004]MDQ8194297.1 hypothetical protein [Coraliomargarita sp. SDUM461004]